MRGLFAHKFTVFFVETNFMIYGTLTRNHAVQPDPDS